LKEFELYHRKPRRPWPGKACPDRQPRGIDH
jgi:hypothetical protein